MVPDDHDVEDLPVPPRGLLNRIRRRVLGIGVRGPAPAPPRTPDTTTVGTSEVDFDWLSSAFFRVSRKRLDIFRDVEEMEETLDEVSTSLDILADEAVNSEKGAQETFQIHFTDTPEATQEYIRQTLHQVDWQGKAFGIARDTLLYGDTFLQNVVDRQMRLVRLMQMPVKTMVRNEDEQGLLKNGTVQGDWAYEQYLNPGSLERFVAGFYPWQISHLRWNRRGSSVYGRPMLFTARVTWKKLRAMEEALVLNWLTRAFARLLFILDITGKSDAEATLYIKRFRESLQQKKIASGTLGTEQLSVVKDIYIGRGYHTRGGKAEKGLTDVEVLDTSSTGFAHLDPIEYYQNKLLMSTRVPKAYLGLERDINAKATLQIQDRRFSRTVRRVQSLLSWGIGQTVTLALLLAGLPLQGVEFEVRWPVTSRTDELDASRTLFTYAKALEVLKELRVVDPEYAALNVLNIDRRDWAQILARLEQETNAVPQQ